MIHVSEALGGPIDGGAIAGSPPSPGDTYPTDAGAVYVFDSLTGDDPPRWHFSHWLERNPQPPGCHDEEIDPRR